MCALFKHIYGSMGHYAQNAENFRRPKLVAWVIVKRARRGLPNIHIQRLDVGVEIDGLATVAKGVAPFEVDVPTGYMIWSAEIFGGLGAVPHSR